MSSELRCVERLVPSRWYANDTPLMTPTLVLQHKVVKNGVPTWEDVPIIWLCDEPGRSDEGNIS